MSQTTYANVPNKIDILKTHMIENILNYNKLELKLHCWDLFNNETVSKITIEYNGNFLLALLLSLIRVLFCNHNPRASDIQPPQRHGHSQITLSCALFPPLHVSVFLFY